MNTPELVKIAQIAGIGVGNREDIEHEFDKRATLNIFTGKNKEMFWNYSKALKELSDDDFYKEANLNTVCNVLEDIDIMYNNKQAYGKTLASP